MSRLFKSALFTASAAVFMSSLPAHAGALIDLGEKVLESKAFIESGLNRANCAVSIKKLNDDTESLSPSDVQLEKAKSEAKQIIKNTFLTRLALADTLKRMTAASGTVDRACLSQIRRAIRVSRSLEEYLAKISGLEADVDVLKGPGGKTGADAEPYLLVNPKFDKFELKSGDILLSRGNAVVSAAIARIGDDDGQFSHAAIVYVDEKTHKTYVVEAHIEIGTDAAPIEEKYVTDGKLRVIVYRQKDPALAQAAAKYAYDVAMNAINDGQRVPYDFGMVLDDENELFCSEIPYMAYKHASQGQFVLGDQYRTTFVEVKNMSFLKGIGVKVKGTFSPSDIEFDSKLDLVAEWRDLGQVYKANRKDAVMSKVFDWMEDGYSFDTAQTSLKAIFSVLVRHIPVLGERAMGDSLAANMNPTTVKYMLAMNFVGNAVLDDLIAEYDKFEKATGLPMTFDQMRAAIEKIRTEDYQRQAILKDWKSSNPMGTSDEFGRPEEPHFVHYFKKTR